MMNVRAKSLMAILLTGMVLGSLLMLSCVPTQAQIVSVLDEHGQRVFINVAPPPAPKLATSKNAAAGSNATKAAQPASGLTGANAAAANAGNAGSHALSSARLEELVQTAANRHGVDANLVRAVMQTESGGNPGAVSRKGAVGLMQLMPTTALELGVTNMFSAQENIEAGVSYLHTLLVRYGGDLDRALAAYNAGAGAVDRAGGVPKYRETRDYVKKVTNNYFAADASKQDTVTATTQPGLSKAPAAAVAAPKTTATRTQTHAAVVVPPAQKIYRTTDASGHVVWANN
jgi:soluble lytic murein transglycosylase-like protein